MYKLAILWCHPFETLGRGKYLRNIKKTYLVIEVRVMATPLMDPNLSGVTELFMNKKMEE